MRCCNGRILTLVKLYCLLIYSYDGIGFEVNYKGHLSSFPPGDIIIRILLLLWTGDHVAQCEICKSKGAGAKNPCRRCKTKGTVT